MRRQLKALLKSTLRKSTTPSLRSAGIRAAFAAMSVDEQDAVRLSWQNVSMAWSLRNLARLGFAPDSIVDVGAFQGDWTRMAKAIFPASTVVMVEAQERMMTALAQVEAEFPGEVKAECALLGSESGVAVSFFELETGSAVYPERSSVPRTVRNLTTETLDSVLSRTGPDSVDLLKLDVQGYELEVLRGADKALSGAGAVVLELALLPVNEGAPLHAEVTRFMLERGFVAYDICGLVRRPLDRALWQADFLFVPESSPLRAKSTFD